MEILAVPYVRASSIISERSRLWEWLLEADIPLDWGTCSFSLVLPRVLAEVVQKAPVQLSVSRIEAVASLRSLPTGVYVDMET